MAIQSWEYSGTPRLVLCDWRTPEDAAVLTDETFPLCCYCDCRRTLLPPSARLLVHGLSSILQPTWLPALSGNAQHSSRGEQVSYLGNVSHVVYA